MSFMIWLIAVVMFLAGVSADLNLGFYFLNPRTLRYADTNVNAN